MANRNYWVIPKNNKSLRRHRQYVSFVVSFRLKNKRFPTKKEYEDGIVEYLVAKGVNKKGKKTAAYHQLYQPLFYKMLKQDGEIVSFTEDGYKFFHTQTGSKEESAIVYLMFDEAAFDGKSTSSRSDYFGVRPIHEMMNNLVKYGQLTSQELNLGFYQTKSEIDGTGGVDVKAQTSSVPFAKRNKWKPAQWKYVIAMLKDAGLVQRSGKTGSFAISDREYDGRSTIRASERLISFARSGSARAVVDDWWAKLDDGESADYKTRQDEIEAQIWREGTIEKTKYRPRQADWRRSLLVKYGKCVMCKLEEDGLLEAAHILPFKDCEGDQGHDPDNGLVMCPNHHKAYDSNIFWLAAGDDGRIRATLDKNHNLNDDDLRLLGLDAAGISAFEKRNMIAMQSVDYMRIRNGLKEYGSTV